jgi:histone-binding protein RBBP4
MPQNCCVIATKTVSGEVHIFDYTKHPSMPGPNAPVNPDLRLVGQAKEGYGLSWNPLRQGLLLSASLDGTIASWDVSQGSATQRTLDPLTLFAGKHSAGVEDVAWSPSESNIFVSVGDDRQVLFWDDRDPANLLASVGNAHAGDVNCVQFCPTDAFTVVTGGADGLVNLWDRRQLAQGPKHTLRHHQTDVVQVAWSPHFSNLLASSSSDRRVALWDFERIGRPQTPQDAEDGPPELLFVHGGHCNRVPDLAWNPHRPWMLCSVAEDNVMQVWQPSSELLEDDDDDDEDPDRG